MAKCEKCSQNEFGHFNTKCIFVCLFRPLLCFLWQQVEQNAAAASQNQKMSQSKNMSQLAVVKTHNGKREPNKTVKQRVKQKMPPRRLVRIPTQIQLKKMPPRRKVPIPPQIPLKAQKPLQKKTNFI
uniref:Retrotransposon gag protein n=1 Tax=Globodera pallida TaxID=36090 RepID=A0A183BJG0_GLOPA